LLKHNKHCGSFSKRTRTFRRHWRNWFACCSRCRCPCGTRWCCTTHCNKSSGTQFFFSFHSHDFYYSIILVQNAL